MRTPSLWFALLYSALVPWGPSQSGLRAFGCHLEETVADYWEVDLDGDGQDEVVLLGQDAPWEFVVFRQSDSVPIHRWPVPHGTAAVAFADVVPPVGSDLVLMSAQGLTVISGSGGTPKPYCEIELGFPPSFESVPVHWSWGKDLDGDGSDDLLVPGVDRDWLIRGSKAGSPEPPAPLGGVATVTSVDRTLGTVRVRRQRPRTTVDQTSPGHPAVFWLDERGVQVSQWSSDGFSKPRLLFPNPGLTTEEPGLLRRLDLDLEDLDGDTLTDLVLTRTEARGGTIPERRTDLLFYLQRRPEPVTPQQVLLLPGVLSSGPQILDANGDGHPDLFLSVFAGDARAELSRRLLRRVDLTYHLYLGLGEGKCFPASPSLTLNDRLDLDTFDTWGLRHRFMTGKDWNGDGKMDLVRAEKDGDRTTFTVLPFRNDPDDHRPQYGEPLFSQSVDLEVTAYGVAQLREGHPSIRVRTRTGIVYLTPGL